MARNCSRCVMDESDPAIKFDKNGVCNHCLQYESRNTDLPRDQSVLLKILHDSIERIKKRGLKRSYDAVLGLSGGADSCYLAYRAKEWGLRLLVVHVDTGWNSEMAVANIEAIVAYGGYELHTLVVDWEEMKDLQLAYLRSGIPNQDVPQDHAIFAGLYRFAVQNKIPTVLSGGNLATEAIFPKSWHGDAMDLRNLRAIHRWFGAGKLRSFPQVSFGDLYFKFPFLLGMKTFRPLNYLNYRKREAIREMEAGCGWKNYGSKHGESMFTKVFQNHYLPRKFGYDKRKPHLSSMIVSGQLSRKEALEILQQPLYDAGELEKDLDYFANKLGISREGLEQFFQVPNRCHREFPHQENWHRGLKTMQRGLKKIMGWDLKAYS